MASWVKVGAKCECIDDNPLKYLTAGYSISDGILVRKGVIYTIKSIGVAPLCGRTTVKLFEVPDRPGRDHGYSIERFRPLITKTQEQDIEMFLRIANDTPFHVMIDEETNV